MGSLTTGSPRGPAAVLAAGLNVQSGHRKWAETILISIRLADAFSSSVGMLVGLGLRAVLTWDAVY